MLGYPSGRSATHFRGRFQNYLAYSSGVGGRARKDACCSSPAAIRYWLGVTIVAWAILSLIGVIWQPLHATSAITVLFAMAAGCFANWIRNRTYHCFIDGPLFLIAGSLFLLRILDIVHFRSWAIWVSLFTGVSISFWLEWRISKRRSMTAEE